MVGKNNQKLPGEPTRCAGRKNGSTSISDYGISCSSYDVDGVNRSGRVPKTDGVEHVLSSPPRTRARCKREKINAGLPSDPQSNKTGQVLNAPDNSHSGVNLVSFSKPKAKYRYPSCPCCKKQVRDNSIQCTTCSMWFHGKCAEFSKTMILNYAKRSPKDRDWNCKSCKYVPSNNEQTSSHDANQSRETPPTAQALKHEDCTRTYKKVPNWMHVDRPTYIPVSSRAMYDSGKLQFPKGCSDMWKRVDDELVQLAGDSVLEQNVDEMMQRYEKVVYEYLKSRYRTAKREALIDNTSVALEAIRKKKQLLKKIWKENKTNEGKREWLSLLRAHNKLRCRQQQQNACRKTERERKEFKNNPYQYSKDLLTDARTKVQPATRDILSFYRATYSDPERSNMYNDPHGLHQADLPATQMDCATPKMWELQNICRKKRTGSSAGPNGIPVLVYKRCPKLLKLLCELFAKIWKSGKAPATWGQARMILIPKKNDAEDVRDFRPICIANTEARLFFSIYAARITKYCISNMYIDNVIQKGFVPNTPGCLEHIETCWNAYADAKESRKTIYISWLDLKNAFGSIRHNLIQYALKRYHVPSKMQKLVFEYYENLNVVWRTSECNHWIKFKRGVFQGCPLSAPLFLMVYNIGLEMLKEQRIHRYVFSSGEVVHAEKGFADDLAIISCTKTGCQSRLDIYAKFLKWADLQANVTKCSAVCFRRQTRSEGTSFVAADPELTLNGEKLPSLTSGEIKYLGKKFDSSAKDSIAVLDVLDRLKEWLAKIDSTRLTGPMKAWILQNAILSRLRWKFAVYDVSATQLARFDAIFTSYYKKWLKVAKCATASILYRRKDYAGMNLSKPSVVYAQTKASTVKLLRNSKDESVKAAARVRERRLKTKKAPTYYDVIREAELEHIYGQQWKSNRGRSGLGYGSRGKTNNASVAHEIRKIDEEKMLARLHSMALQGAWLRWDDQMKIDISWQSVIRALSPALLSFAVNAVGDTLPSPSNLKRWGRKVLGSCYLCHTENCTLAHILNGCPISLQQKRYTWRHDQVLAKIADVITPLIKKANRMANTMPAASTTFVSSKGAKIAFPVPGDMEREILQQANDWQMESDSDSCQYVFPAHITETALRPDIIIFSNQIKRVILLELTVPMEARVQDSYQYKLAKYSKDLIPQIKSAGWLADLWPIEVTSRGAVAHSLRKSLLKLGMKRKWLESSLFKISRIALRASYVIWLSRKNPSFKNIHLVPHRDVQQNREMPYSTSITTNAMGLLDTASPEQNVVSVQVRNAESFKIPAYEISNKHHELTANLDLNEPQYIDVNCDMSEAVGACFRASSEATEALVVNNCTKLETMVKTSAKESETLTIDPVLINSTCSTELSMHNEGSKLILFGIEISVRELRSLRPKQWFFDSVLDCYFQHLANIYDSLLPIAAPLMQLLQNTKEPRMKTFSRRLREQSQAKQDLVAPFNVRGNHWCLLHIGMDTSEVTIYDTMATGHYNISAALRRIEGYIQVRLKPPIHHFQDSVQNDGFSCGPLVARICRAIGEGCWNFNFETEEAELERRRIWAAFANANSALIALKL